MNGAAVQQCRLHCCTLTQGRLLSTVQQCRHDNIFSEKSLYFSTCTVEESKPYFCMGNRKKSFSDPNSTWFGTRKSPLHCRCTVAALLHCWAPIVNGPREGICGHRANPRKHRKPDPPSVTPAPTPVINEVSPGVIQRESAIR